MTLARPPAPTSARFDLLGDVQPLAKGGDGYVPRRQLGGWLATYGKIADDGSVVPTRDRQGHIMEAASAIGGIDFSEYLAKGLWNDTHQGYPGGAPGPRIHVGVPRALEFHDATTALAKAHRKVGFWTEGHLFDREDPRSWTLYTDYQPTSRDLDRADYFWGLATMLKGMPRPLGFSAQGKMLISPCGNRIIWAQIAQNAVCEMPQNPDSAALPMALAVDGERMIRREMVGAAPCDSCRCPPGARCKLVSTAKASGVQVGTFSSRQDLEPGPATRRSLTGDDAKPTGAEDRYAHLVRLLCESWGLDERRARRWIATWAAANTPKGAQTTT